MLVPNPKYYSALKRGANTTWLKKEVLLNPYNMPLPATLPVINGVYETTVSLYPKQREVFDDVVGRSSALVYARTAFGKTVVIAALTQAWKGSTLILSHSKENVAYIKETIEKFTGLECGVYYSLKKDIKPITVTTFSSFRQKYGTDLKGFKNLIVDEADTFFADKARHVTCKYPAKRKFGFTGTIRTLFDLDNDPTTLEAFYGYLHTVEADIEDTPLEKVFFRKYNKVYKDEDNVMVHPSNWHEFKELLDNDIDRKRAMLSYIQEESDGFALVLFDRVKDVLAFYHSSKKRGIKCFMSYGSQSNKERTEHMEAFRKEGGILYSQYKTVGRGWNMTNLDKVFILFPMKGESTVRQIFGRVLRVFSNKKSYVYLFADSSLAFQLKKQKATILEFFNINVEEI
jgi:superfamily II DNA or RNA helicase